MLIEFRNAMINTNAISAIVPYADDDGTFTVRIMTLGSRGLTFNEVTREELSSLASAMRNAFERVQIIE